MKPNLLVQTLTAKQLDQIHAQILKSATPRPLNLLLRSLTNSSTPQNAFPLYNRMLMCASSHNQFTFTHALRACSYSRALHKGLEIHGHVVKTGHYADRFIMNSLIHFYTIGNDVFSAREIFNEINDPDVVSWTSIISGLAKSGFEWEAIARFSLMNVKPNGTTLVSVVSACSCVRAVNFAKAIHCYSLKEEGFEGNILLENAILDCYVKHGRSSESARHLFVRMTERDVISWTTMVGGLSQRGLHEEAICLFEQMIDRGEVEPNEATIVSVLSAVSSISDLSKGKMIHRYLKTRLDLTQNINVGNAIINMYAKCGDMAMATGAFIVMGSRDMVSWSTMISGMAMNGHSMHVLPLFALMLINGVQPDDVTFVGLLSACSHGGMVDHGMVFFDAMDDVYGIMPSMQHYGCMVDMFGRAGLLKDAERFVKGMRVEADGKIWGALLNASQIHGDEEMFDRISHIVGEVEGVSVGTFTLLSNGYANSKRWDDANVVRGGMRSMGLKKIAGYSRIEVTG